MFSVMKCEYCDELAGTIIAVMREYHKAERELAEAAFSQKGALVLEEINARITALLEKRAGLLESFTHHIEQQHESDRLVDGLKWIT